MFSRLLNRNPHTRKRAVAVTVDFLKQHKDRIFIETFARHTVANIKVRGVDAALDGYGPHAQAQVGHYPEYAVHLARYAVIACSPFLTEPLDDRDIYVDTGMAVYQALACIPRLPARRSCRQSSGHPRMKAATASPTSRLPPCRNMCAAWSGCKISPGATQFE